MTNTRDSQHTAASMPVDVYSAPLHDRPEPAKPTRPPKALIVRIADQLIVFPGTCDYGSPRCVSAGKKPGSRCDWTVDEDYHGFSQLPILGYEGSVSVLEHNATDEGYLRQRCSRHLEANAPNVIDPQWEKFDPEQHQHLIYPHRSFWTPEGLRTRVRDDSGSTPSDDQQSAGGSFDDILAVADADRAARRLAEWSDTALYSYYDADDISLYIGISDDLRVRTLAHIEASSWMDFAARSTITRHPSREEALRAEKTAIESERPLFNHVHNDTPEARQRLVAYLVEHGRMDLLTPAVSRG